MDERGLFVFSAPWITKHSRRCLRALLSTPKPTPANVIYGPPRMDWEYSSPWSIHSLFVPSPSMYWYVDTFFDDACTRYGNLLHRKMMPLEVRSQLQLVSTKSTACWWHIDDSVRSLMPWWWVQNDFQLCFFIASLISRAQSRVRFGVCFVSFSFTPFATEKPYNSAPKIGAPPKGKLTAVVRWLV